MRRQHVGIVPAQVSGTSVGRKRLTRLHTRSLERKVSSPSKNRSF